MPDELYPSMNREQKNVSAATSLWRLFFSIVLKIVAVACALLALFGLKYLAEGVHAVLTIHQGFFATSAEAMGSVLGSLVDAPFLIGLLFSWLAYHLWRFADGFKQKKADAPATGKAPVHHTLAMLFIHFLCYVLIVLALIYSVNSLLGAVLILFVVSEGAGRTLFIFDYLHEVLFWLPFAACLLTGGLAYASVKFRTYVRARFAQAAA